MDKIAIVTDSTSDLDRQCLDRHGIYVLPLKVVYSDREYSDRVDITPAEVYQSLSTEVPRTSLPSPGETLALFERLRSQGITRVLCIHISSGLSGTWQMVRTVAGEFPDMKIEVLDSKTLSLGLGLTVLEAARAVQDGQAFDQVVTRAREVIAGMNTFFVVGTLEYLIKGGRIGYVAGSLGELLRVKPIISINEEGKYYTVDKVRGRKKSLQRIYEIVREHAALKKVRVAVCHGGAGDEANAIAASIGELENVEEVIIGEVGPVIVVHTGPGLVGVAFY